MMRLEKKHPLAIRWFHWINFPLLLVMIWSGLLIYWANSVYRIGIGRFTLMKMTFSNPTWKALGVSYRLAEGLSLHFFFMWLFAINGLLYVIYTIVSGEWRYLIPNRSTRKFNRAQQVAYLSIILAGFGSLLTGIAIYKPVQFAWLTWLFGGYQMARWFHFWLTVGFVVFFVIHVVQVIRAGWNNFRAMVIGYEVREVPHD
jgi:thiosulfate reductase cytochrome b subunit